MNIGVPREIKDNENQVAVVPSGVETLTQAGHSVIVEAGAGVGTGIPDLAYAMAGATLVSSAGDVWARADLICKVKEPLPSEWRLIRKGQTIFTYFHFAASRELTDAMVQSEAICISYETVEVNHTLPLLTPMSEIAGKMAMQEAAKYLEKPQGGRGILLGGVPGVPAAHVVILGGGVVGIHAAKIAAGMGANVTIMDVNLDRLRYLDDVLPANVTTYFSNALHIREILPTTADVVIGAVLIKGSRAPVLVREVDLRTMRPGSVIVDVAVDQGGCIETMHPTTHAIPVFTVNDVVHYEVANIPGAVPATSTYALTNATAPYLMLLANRSVRDAVLGDVGLRGGLAIAGGRVYQTTVAKPFGLPVASIEDWQPHS